MRKRSRDPEPDEELSDSDEEELLKKILGTTLVTPELSGIVTKAVSTAIKSKKEKTVAKTPELTGWEMFDIAVKHLRVVYIWGPPGIAKTHHSIDLLTEHLHANVSKKAVPTITTLNEDKVWQELMGHYLPTDGGGMQFHYGPLAQALMGGAVIVNELCRASGAVLDGFLEVMDGQHVAQISMPDGKTISPHEHFKMVATANEPVDSLDPALQDRMQVVIKVTEPHPATIEALNTGYRGLGDIIRDSYRNVAHAMSVRAGFTFAELVKQKVDFEIAGRMAFQDRWGDISSALKLEA